VDADPAEPMGAQIPSERVSAERYEILAVASSAGGVSALRDLLAALPGDFPVPMVVVQHLDPRHQTVIAEVIGRHSPLTVKVAEGGESVKAGVVYVAPPDHHLLIDGQGTLTLSHSALVHFVRPSADLLFESVAGAYGARVIACVLTGTGSDGTMGASAIKSRGGTVIAEDPELAEFKGMPEAVVSAGTVDFVLPLDEIATVIRGLVQAGSS